ncbi:MAG TPA: UDP-N-acetylmuramate dehydrogenase [Pirellulaceae bacterium]|nr:UDP-N-acetylmuramate dehydrogenase [Pirellulaceae bacterium]
MSLFSGLEHVVRENEPLAPYTTLRLGGVAEYFAEPTSIDELSEIIQRAKENEMPIRLIGGGSNILVRDEGVPGMVLQLSAPAFGQLVIEGELVTVGGGVSLPHFVSATVREDLAGAHHLVGIPGTVGGALHANSGTGGHDIGRWLIRAAVVTRSGQFAIRESDALSFSYRSSSLNELAIIEATFRFPRDTAGDLTRRLQKLWIVKRSQQPLIGDPCAYVFKNHGGEPAGELIERAGLKGTQMGKVELFDRNPNFFVAHPGAKSADVLRLIDLVKSQVQERLSIDLSLSLDLW